MTYNDELYHYGVLGMKWGKRRYTNPDGTLNALGKKRKAMDDARSEHRKASVEANAKYKQAKKEYKDLKKQTAAELKASKRVSTGKAVAISTLTSVAATTAGLGIAAIASHQLAIRGLEYVRDTIRYITS